MTNHPSFWKGLYFRTSQSTITALRALFDCGVSPLSLSCAAQAETAGRRRGGAANKRWSHTSFTVRFLNLVVSCDAIASFERRILTNIVIIPNLSWTFSSFPQKTGIQLRVPILLSKSVLLRNNIIKIALTNQGNKRDDLHPLLCYSFEGGSTRTGSGTEGIPSSLSAPTNHHHHHHRQHHHHHHHNHQHQIHNNFVIFWVRLVVFYVQEKRGRPPGSFNKAPLGLLA